MARNKRHAEDTAPTESNGVHESRQKRLKYSEEDAKLASIYNDLADEVQEVRLKAAGQLFKHLASKSPDQQQRLEVAKTRLIRGLCSGRKAARLGFSVALAEVFRLNFSRNAASAAPGVSLENTINRIVTLTTVQGNVSGQERRDYGLGRRFAYQAVLQSDIVTVERFTDREWQLLVNAILKLASQKQWLRRECGAMLYEYLISPNGSKLSDERVRLLIDEVVNHKLAKTPEGVGLWITVHLRFPQVKFPKDVWHHRDPLNSKEREGLVRVMVETSTDDETPAQKSGSRQATPSFAWTVILTRLYQDGDNKDFLKFWDSASRSMFASTASLERKALGLQVFSLAIVSAPQAMLADLFKPVAVLQCLLDQRSNQERILYDAAKAPLQKMVTRGKEDGIAAAIIIKALVENDAVNFDQLTKTKTMETLICEANGPVSENHSDMLRQAVNAISNRITNPGVSEAADAQNKRRALADLLLNILRARDKAGNMFQPHFGGTNLDSPSGAIVATFIRSGYAGPDTKAEPAVTDQTRTLLRSRLMSCLGVFVNQPLYRAVATCSDIVYSLHSHESGLESHQQGGAKATKAVSRAVAMIKQVKDQDADPTTTPAFQLLFSLSIIQVYNNEPDSLAVLEDLMECYESREQNDSPTLLVELLLSFVSKPSALFRKLAEQVFTAFAPQLTADGLQSLTDILGQKESLSGQKELFEEDTEMADMDEEGDEAAEEDEFIDVEEESDVEIVNGYEVEKDSHDDSSDASMEETSDAEDDSSSEIDDEEAAFDKKLADALGTNGIEGDSEDDGSDMDDEQMMALEPHLTSIFQERQKTTTKKQDKKDAKENIVNFKNRVLDLLTIYVKSQHADLLALDLILPLLNLIRSTGSKPTAEKAFALLKQYFEACNKNKEFPVPEDVDACFAVLEAVLEETKSAESKLHGNACSRSALFLCKVLITQDKKLYGSIAGLYAALQTEWYLDSASKVPNSVFTEWTSWSIATRKNA